MTIRRRGAGSSLPCPAKGCTSGRKPEQVLCAHHWYQVPKPLRDRVWLLYKSEPRSAAHLAAVREAVQAVNDAALEPTTPAA